MAVADVVRVYLEGSGLSLRRFAGALTESLEYDLNHSTIIAWRDGKSEPGTDFLLQCALAYGGWRRRFAVDCLRAKLPEVFVDQAFVFCRVFAGVGDEKEIDDRPAGGLGSA